MGERIVVNSGPLIAFARADALPILARLPIELLAPTEVQAELDEGAAAGYPPIVPSCVTFVALRGPLSPVALTTLDLGEAAVIQLALELQARTVAIDERKARRAARAVGLEVTGTLGLLGRAKQLGILSDVRPYVERMLAAGQRYDARLVRSVLEALGE